MAGGCQDAGSPCSEYHFALKEPAVSGLVALRTSVDMIV